MKQQSLIFLLVLILVAVVSLAFISNSASASVTGPCANCHTMHNSQGGTTVAVGGAGAGWNSANNLVGTAQATASAALTVSDCVGCHSATTGATIVALGGSRIPIVYNINGAPDQPLAGGNFYWVVNGNPADHPDADPDEFGHNVLGISAKDEVLTMAPGNRQGCGSKGCHFSLATYDDQHAVYGKTGCQGCHFEVAHHNDNSAYRFLYGHGAGPVNRRYVEGLEDADWEQSPDANVHNEYKGNPDDHGTSGTSNLNGVHNMSAYCKGCHTDFHLQGDGTTWIRHPSDAVLPADDPQYAAYTAYNPQAPVARQILPGSPSSEVAPGTDMVMCLSCHRPHGSPHPDILRWNYSTMIADGGGADGEGCFVCHTNKDGS